MKERDLLSFFKVSMSRMGLLGNPWLVERMLALRSGTGGFGSGLCELLYLASVAGYCNSSICIWGIF